MGDRPGFFVSSAESLAMHVRSEDDDDEFRSCCGGDEKDSDNESDCECEGRFEDDLKQKDDEHEKEDDFVAVENAVKMYFKGVSVEGINDTSCGFTGIGVVIEGPGLDSAIRVQKKLGFCVEEPVADYLALIDGLSEAVKCNLKRVLAATDSRLLYDQILLGDDNPLTDAFRERICQLTRNLESFKLKLVPDFQTESPLHLARVAIGIVSLQDAGHQPRAAENCLICCEDRPFEMMIDLRCSHKFCSHCMKSYVEGKVQTAHVPIICPQPRCKYLLSSAECKAFLPVMSYDLFQRAHLEAMAFTEEKLYCPYPNCSALVDLCACFSTGASSSSQSDSSCLECSACHRLICVECGVPWHTSLSCEEYQDLPLDERDSADITFHHLAQDRRWRRCQQCRRMIELAQGCFHMTCWCGHEFCYSCGAEYRDGQQTCQCAFWDEPSCEELALPPAAHETEQWPWDSFPMILDAYSDQERSQLALIQRFLAGGFSLSDHLPYQSPPRCTDSFTDAMKDLHQLPWLERFVSVISDNYYDDYIH